VPMLIGTNRTETTVLIGEYQTPDVDVFALDDAGLRAQATRYTGISEPDLDRVLALYKMNHRAASPSEIFFLLTTDKQMRLNAITQAERKAAQNRAPPYMYL